MEFSKYLLNREEKATKLVEELGKYFDYVSILGTDVAMKSYSISKQNSNVSDSPLNECGFVVRLNNGYGFFEYAFNDFKGNVKEFAEEIKNKFSISKEIADSMIKIDKIVEEELVKDFSRDTDIDEYSSKDILDFLTLRKDDCLKYDNIVNASASLKTTKISKMFISKKRHLKQHYGYVNGTIFVVYFKEGKTTMAFEACDNPNIKVVFEQMLSKPEVVCKKAYNLSLAKQIKPGYYDVITAPSITGLIVHEAFGHGVEMDQFVKDRALAKKYVNDYVASPLVNMHDGASATLSVASYFFDDDGVLAHDTQIIKDGILVSGICDFASSKQLNFNPTGNSRRQGFSHKAYTRMTNTFFERGKDKLSDMIKSIKHGYMLFDTNNGMEDPKNWNIQCVCEYGREIIDGKLTDNYVSPVVMSGNVLDLLKSISMVSDDFEISGTGMCGKGYKEWVTVSDGGPYLKAKVKLG